MTDLGEQRHQVSRVGLLATGAMVVGNTDILVIVPAKGQHQPEQTVEDKARYSTLAIHAC